jgi:hypothetical protein
MSHCGLGHVFQDNGQWWDRVKVVMNLGVSKRRVVS